MENKSHDGGVRSRHEGGQSGTGQGRNRNRNRSRNRNRNRSRNRGGHSPNQGQSQRNSSSRGGNRNRGGRNRGGRSRKQPQPTAWEKFLSTVTFGLLGKPAPKKRGKPSAKKGSKPAPEAEKPKKPSSKPSKPFPRVEVTTPRLYVGNLDYKAAEPDLEELFRGAGNVMSAEVVTNSRTQQSKGFAFVEMGTTEEARRAVEILDNQDFMGRQLIVTGAKSDGPKEGGEGETSDEETSALSAESRA